MFAAKIICPFCLSASLLLITKPDFLFCISWPTCHTRYISKVTISHFLSCACWWVRWKLKYHEIWKGPFYCCFLFGFPCYLMTSKQLPGLFCFLKIGCFAVFLKSMVIPSEADKMPNKGGVDAAKWFSIPKAVPSIPTLWDMTKDSFRSCQQLFHPVGHVCLLPMLWVI